MKKETNYGGLTLVTGLWNIKRDELSEGWARSFNHYLRKFEQFLDAPCNLIIFGEEELQTHILNRRNESSTQFIIRNQDWFKKHFYEKIQNIRTNPNWYNQAPWLKDSTQGSLEMYNPLVMSKMFLLNDAKILDKFNSDYLFWMDAGITNTVHPGYFTHDKVFDKLPDLISNFTFLAFPYKAEKEIHGFSYPEINKFATQNVELVCRGGFFGGSKQSISEVNGLYYSVMSETLNEGFMGTEESLFSILLYKYPELFSYYKLEENGLINKFFEDIKNNRVNFKSIIHTSKKTSNKNKTALYVISYNSPDQFESLCLSMERYDSEFLSSTKKFLLNNSIDRSTDEKYKNLCLKYGFEEIKKHNIGICGGRQFIAEHFQNETDLDYYFFFEDDMNFYEGDVVVCRNGFNRIIDNLFQKSIKIMDKENFDFLKLNFSEFFGDNSKQWAWYNVPQNVRTNFWPEYDKLPQHGIDPDSPHTLFKNIKSYNGVPYATGDVYYSNWPQLVSHEGNRKMFLETKWAHPFEQTWMSHIFQETKKGIINGGILLSTPTEHHRFDHYPKEERKEN